MLPWTTKRPVGVSSVSCPGPRRRSPKTFKQDRRVPGKTEPAGRSERACNGGAPQAGSRQRGRP
eukprot:11629563-Alexandrium_andersonii.AAC.1